MAKMFVKPIYGVTHHGLVGRTTLQAFADATRYGMKQATMAVAADNEREARGIFFDFVAGRNAVQVVRHPQTGVDVLMSAPRW